MALRKQPFAIQFAGGVETKLDSKQVPPTKLLNLENATFIKQSTLAKRNGYRALGRLVDDTGTAYGDPVGLAVARGSELHLFDGERGLSYRASVDRWQDAGGVCSLVVSDEPLARTGTNQKMPDHATNEGVTVAAWEDSRGGVWCTLVEADGGRVLMEPFELDADGAAPRCVPCGTVLHVYWADAANSRIQCVVFNPALPASVPTPVTLISDLSAAVPTYDACPFGVTSDNGSATQTMIDEQPAIIAWSTLTGWRLAYVHPSGVIGSPVTGLPSAGTYADVVVGGIACTYDKVGQTQIGVAIAGSAGNVRIRLADVAALAGGSLTTPHTTSATGGRITCEFDESTDGGLWWAVEDPGSRTDLCVVATGRVDGAGVETAAPAELRGHMLITRAFVDGGVVHLGVVHAVKYYPYVAIVRLEDTDLRTRGVGRLLPGISTGALDPVHLSSVHAVEPDASYLSRDQDRKSVV